jgi:pheromone a factor receptor
VTGRLLGKGGYGKVLVGIDQQSQRQLACKVVNLRGLYDRSTAPNLRSPDVPKSLATSARDRWPSKVVRCFREFEVLKDVSHPNIISIEKVFWNSNTIYIFEELVTGGDLFSYIEYKQGCLTDVEAAVIVRQVLIGIEYLHNLGIVHRDLKPDNVLMSSLEDGARIVITDFGNARHLPSANPTSFSRSSSRRRMHSLVGTFEYAAPEIHCRNPMIPAKHGYCKAVDMWSIGSITSALLSGDVIFTDRAHPDYYEKPFEVIMRLAARCDTSIIDDPTDTAWSKVGDEPKDFVKKLLVLREEDRLTATEALAHPWFSNRRHAPEFKALYDRAIKDWRPPRNPEDLVETILDISPAALQQRTKLSEHFAPASLQQSLRPSSSSRQTRLSPVAEVHEEDRFEDPNAYQYQSYDQQSYNQQFNDIDIKDPDCAQPGTHLHRPDSFDDSMQQLSVDSDPPASGMYPAHVPDARYFYDYGLSQVEVENSQQGEDPLSPTPETQTESLLVCETPPTRAGAKCPASSQEMINCESPIKVGTKRQLSSQNMIVCERPTKRGTKRPPSAEGMLPLYEMLFGGNSAATGYVVQKKKKKLCYGKKPNSDYC